MYRFIIISILLSILFVHGQKPEKVRVVELTESSTEAISSKKTINIIPGDIIDDKTAYISKSVSTITFSSMAGIAYIENLSDTVNYVNIEVFVGPIGDKKWIKIADQGLPLQPNKNCFFT